MASLLRLLLRVLDRPLFGGISADRRVRAARIGATLFIGGGLTVLATMWFLDSTVNRAGLATWALIAIALGILTPLLPWQRWPHKATASLPLLAAGILVIGGRVGGGEAIEHYLVLVTLVFVFDGLTQSPGASLLKVPVVAVGYYLATSGLSDAPPTTVVVIATPVWVLAGEVLALAVRRQERAEQGLAKLLDAVTALRTSGDERSAVDETARLAAELVDAESALVLLPGEGKEAILVNAGQYNVAAPAGEILVDVRDRSSWVGETLRRGRSHFVSNVAEQSGISPRPLGVVAGKSALYVPVPSRQGRLGVIVVVWTRHLRVLDGVVLQAAELLAEELGHALDRIQTLADLTQEAGTDPLTGLANRRTLSRALESLKVDDALILLDLDHFKAVNDTMGHARGDEALCAFARCLEDVARKGDVVARYGGEEFALILPRSGLDGAQRVAFRLREIWQDSLPITTFSAGLVLHRRGDSAPMTFARADAALYRAKELGRDRIEVADDVIDLNTDLLLDRGILLEEPEIGDPNR